MDDLTPMALARHSQQYENEPEPRAIFVIVQLIDEPTSSF